MKDKNRNWKAWYQYKTEYLVIFYRWAITGIAMGIGGGLLGTLFHKALHLVTGIRGEFPWLIFLLPFGGLLSVRIYKIAGLSNNRGVNEVIEGALNGRHIKPQIGIGIFAATVITHFFGGSAGREGAALQIGGAMASVYARVYHFTEENRKILVLAGMSAVFAGLFGTPLTATIFCMEFASVGTIFSPAFLPCFIAAFAASRISLLFGVHAETHMLEIVFDSSLTYLVRYLILAMLISVLGMYMCKTLHLVEHLASQYITKPSLRIFVGGCMIVILTLIAGDQRFNGAGMEMVLQAVAGDADWYSFLAKLVFTLITVASGFKGGEIVPTFCIGATFGCVVGNLLGLDAGFAAALGLVGLFCCATNSPIASIFLSIEMFGSANLYLFAFVCVVCFVLSGRSGLYGSQVIQFVKETRIGKFKNEKTPYNS